MPTSMDMLGSVQLPDRKVCEFNPPVRVAAYTVPLEAGAMDAARVNVLPATPKTPRVMLIAVEVAT